jgi:hypothetical protein
MKKFIYFIIPFVLIGCKMKTHRDYAFSELQYKTSCELMIFSRLRGAMKVLDDGDTVSEAPYELLMWATSVEPEFQEIRFSVIELTGVNKRVHINLEAPDSGIPFKKAKDGNKASMLVPGLDIEYVDYDFSFTYLAKKQDGSTCSEDLSYRFEKRQNDKKVSVWDSLMGI